MSDPAYEDYARLATLLGTEVGVLDKAADEIERLRAALHNLQGCDIDNAAQDIIIRALEQKP